ncbi:hypothetical protein DKE52_010395 [Acinetobacter pittii]|uniref:Uncharacterized protein n=1 Tax=Acinetobacter pittii TaxID=48296 RepID=A0A3G6YJL3_ACIPI|nr:hypothetical protein DKE52_010395 [Acinetobacter pittii]
MRFSRTKKKKNLKKEIIGLIESQKKISKALSVLIEGFAEPDAYFYDSFKSEYLVLLENIKSKAFDFSESLSLLELKLDEKLINLSLELIFDFSPLEKSFRAFN